MKPDQVVTNPGGSASANPEYLAAVRDDAIEDAPEQLLPFELLEKRRFELVISMTAVRFAELTRTEKRNFRRWAEHYERVFTEKANLFRRNSPADLDTPTYLQARG